MKRLVRSELAFRAALGAGVFLCLATAALHAEEEVVQNDTEGGHTPVGDFVQGEHAGARLTSPCDGTIVAVQILWGALLPGHPQSLEEAIHIYDGPSFPTPGTQLALLQGPVMTPGYVNEFRYLDEAQTMPLNVPVTNGQEFYVTLEFFNATDVGSPGFGPSVVRDVDGCQAGKNVIYLDQGFWMSSCLLGVKGDFAIRAVIDCPESTGACCDFDATCANDVEEGDCQGVGQTFFVGQTCAQVTCPPPTGACCILESCLDDLDEHFCTTNGGVYAGDGSTCADVPYPCEPGACCFLNGDCLELLVPECAAQGGTFFVGGTCDPNTCTQPSGACCHTILGCFGQIKAQCEALNPPGTWAGPFTTCFPDLCPICDDGDFDRDGDVDLEDFADFQQCFGAPAGAVCKCLDMDNDNDVDTADLELFVDAVESPSGGPH